MFAPHRAVGAAAAQLRGGESRFWAENLSVDRGEKAREWGLGGLILPGLFVHAVDRRWHCRAGKRLAHGAIVTFSWLTHL